ncbi:translocation/assembly module TamB domain-containing protein [uncultured Devosia sp.]|uniref:translocation/assembly module TamB domain-containing protein n=1 Tax=uncultured Devosia sp. TaxID=211434 RepID=UPI0035CC2004
MIARLTSLPRRLLLLILVLAGFAIAVPVAIVAQDVLTMSDAEQKDWLTNFVQDRLSTPERQIRLSNIDGALGSDVSIREITISDAEGVWLRVNNAQLNWNQAGLFLGRLEVRSLKADSIEYLRNAVPAEGVDLPPVEAGSLTIPEFPVAVILEELSVPQVTFGENVFGLGSQISLAGALTLEGGNLTSTLDIVRLDGPGGTLNLAVAYTKADNAIDLGVQLVEPENGVMANLLNIEGRPAVELSVAGKGPVADLQTSLTLKANGQTALGGGASVAQTAEGFAIAADLRGPVSGLMAEQYRPFFGAETALTANALVRSAGGISISGLKLTGGQLSLDATAETTPDNFLRQLTLNAVVGDAAGTPVRLPVPGSPITVGSAQIAVDFGRDNSENWTSTLVINALDTGDLAAQTVGLTLGGVAANLSDPATRRLTFNGDGTISGIAGSEAVEAALGDSIGLGIAGLWNAGEPVQLAQFRLAGKALTAGLTGVLDGPQFKGDIAIDTSSIAPFSGLAGRQLDGALSLQANGSFSPVNGGFDLTLDGTGTNLGLDDTVADGILEGVVALSGRVARTEAGLLADNFKLGNNQVQLAADGTYASAMADFTFNLDLADLALLSDQAQGAVKVVGTAKGQDGVLDLNLDARLAAGQLAGRDFRQGAIQFAGRSDRNGLTGDISGDGMLDGFKTSLAAAIALDSVNQALSGLDFQAAGTRISGDLSRSLETGLLTGGLAMQSPDVSVPAALALLDAEGEVDAELRLAPQQEKQAATVVGTVKGLSVNDIRVGSAEIRADVTDLFGVPAINGTLNGADIAAAGVDVTTLAAKASQSGDTTAFDAQARLATGTDIDVAGSLTPIAEGYRLALDRAALQQGDLSARLAQPSVLTVAGSRVALDAVRFDVGSGSITASGSAGDALDIVLDISALPLSIANAVAPDLGLAGTLDGRATISGTSSDPRVAFEARGSGINAAAIRDFGIAPLTLSTSGSYAGQTVSLASISANGAGGLTVSGSGSVPLGGNGLDVTLKGNAPLALASRFVADRGAQLSGSVSLDAQVSGSIAAPKFSGRVSTSNAGYIDPELNLRLQGINGTASLNGDRVVIDSLTAGLATGGSVAASGSVGLSGGFPADINLALNSARYADGNLFVATVQGNLTLTGNLTGNPLLSGDVLVEKADITVPESLGGGAAMIDVRHIDAPPQVDATLARARVDAAGAPVPQSRPGGLLLDINVNAPNQIFIRGRGLDAEVGGSVRLTGPIGDIQPVGGFQLNRGRLAILGQRVTFESGSVTLVGDLDPMLNLVARTEGDDITVFVTVSGRVSDINVSFTSSPVLPQDEVLSRLIFKRGIGELSPLQLAKLAAAAAELVGGSSNGSLLDSLRGAAGLDDLDVVTDDQGNVAVQAGTYIQDNVYLGVQAGASGQSKVTINLDVTDDLKVTGAAGANGDSSLGVFYETDY